MRELPRSSWRHHDRRGHLRLSRPGGDPAASHVRLEADDGGAQEGTVLLAGDRNELVMVASGLRVPAAGREYRCWVETSGEPMTIGRMYRAGELAYWVGELEQAITDDELTFGVTLVDAASSGLTGDVVLIGPGYYIVVLPMKAASAVISRIIALATRAAHPESKKQCFRSRSRTATLGRVQSDR